MDALSTASVDLLVLVFAVVVLSALWALRLSHRIGMPSLLLYLFIGLALGESGIGFRFDDGDLTRLLGSLMLALILIDGGFTTRLSEIRPVVGLASALAAAGTLLTVAVTGGLAYLLLDVDVRTATLLGAVVASTDAAATFAVLRRLPLRRRTRATLEAESGFNDPPIIILATVVASEAWHTASPAAMAGTMLYQLLLGAVIGILIGFAGRWVLANSALPTPGVYPLAVLSIAFIGFAVAGMVQASGLLACYVAGVVLGNGVLPHHYATRSFVGGVAHLGQIVLFVMLGLLASPARLGEAVLPALVVGAALTFVARPIAVALCATPFRVPLREQGFLMWAGLRGAVPIVVATIPMTNGIPGAARIFDTVFLLVVLFTLLQGPLLPFVARRCGVLDDGTSREVELESAPLEAMKASFIQVSVTSGSRLHGVYLEELRLPPSATTALIMRDGGFLGGDTQLPLQHGDNVVIAIPDADLPEAERRLRAVSRAGRLASWFGEAGHETPAEQPRSSLNGSRVPVGDARAPGRVQLDSGASPMTSADRHEGRSVRLPASRAGEGRLGPAAGVRPGSRPRSAPGQRRGRVRRESERYADAQA